MRLEMFILMTIGLLLAGWLTHSQSIAVVSGLTGQKPVALDNADSVNNPIASLGLDTNTILGQLMGVIAIICVGLGAVGIIGTFIPGVGNLFSSIGFASVYVLPAFIVIGLVSLEVFVFPLGFVLSAGDYIRIPVLLIYNGLLIATIVQVVAGR